MQERHDRHDYQWAIIARSMFGGDAVVVAASNEVREAFELLHLTPADVWQLPDESATMVRTTPLFVAWEGELVWENGQPYMDGSRGDSKFTDLHPVWLQGAYVLTPTEHGLHLATGYGRTED